MRKMESSLDISSMKENIISALSGSATAVGSIVVGAINVSNMFEIFVLGLIGGVAGYLGKLLVDGMIGAARKIKVRRKKH